MRALACAQLITDTLPTKEIKYEVWYNITAIRYNMYADAGIDRLAAYAEGQSTSSDTRLKDTSFMLIVQRMVDEAIVVRLSRRAMPLQRIVARARILPAARHPIPYRPLPC